MFSINLSAIWQILTANPMLIIVLVTLIIGICVLVSANNDHNDTHH